MRQLLVYALISGLFYFSEGKLRWKVKCSEERLLSLLLIIVFGTANLNKFTNLNLIYLKTKEKKYL